MINLSDYMEYIKKCVEEATKPIKQKEENKDE